MARIPTRRCKECREANHPQCALIGCYCNCAGSKAERQRQLRNRAWRAALIEGRVLRFPRLDKMTSYPTREAAEIALSDALAAGIKAEYVAIPE